MKKILIAVIAAFCLCSCMMDSQEDAIYTIALSYEKSSDATAKDPDCKALVKEFQNAISTMKENNHSNWEWIETIYDGHFSKSDKEAQKKYDKYLPEVKALFDTYQAKFNALPVTEASYSAEYNFMLYRSLNGDKDLASTKFSISYNK